MTWREQLGSDHRDLHLLPVQADEFVQQKEQRGGDQEDVETRLLEEGETAVYDRLWSEQKDKPSITSPRGPHFNLTDKKKKVLTRMYTTT